MILRSIVPAFLVLTLNASAIAAERVPELLRRADVAFSEGLPAVAQGFFEEASAQEDITPDAAVRARLGLARALLEQGRTEEAQTALSALPTEIPAVWEGPALLLRAETALNLGKAEAALSLLEPDPAPGFTELDAVRRALLLARAQTALGRVEAALAVVEGMPTNLPPDLLSLQLVQWGEALAKAGNAEAAREKFSAAANGPLHLRAVQHARLELAARAMEAGSFSNALTWVESVVSSNRVHRSLVPVALRLQAGLWEQSGSFEQAAGALRSLAAQTADPREQALVRVEEARLLILQGALAPAADLLSAQIGVLGDAPEAGAVQLALAQAYAAKPEAPAAGKAFQAYLEVFSDPEGRVLATDGLAWSLAEQKDWEAAARMYEKAFKAAQETHALRARSLFRWADTTLESGNPSRARELYEQFIRLFPEDERVPNALFQAAVCRVREEAYSEAILELERLRVLHPESPFAERALLEKAGALSRSMRYQQALGAYAAYLSAYPEGEFRVHALMDQGLTAYRLGLFDDALLLFDEVLQKFPRHERAEQAFFMRGWALYLTRRYDEALEVCRNFLTTYPESRWAADVRFWVGEQAFNQGRFDEAEREFDRLAVSTRDPELQSRAYYLAGRSAFSAKNFQRAIEFFTRAISAAPEATRVADALFFQADALTELNRFDAAIVVFDDLITRFPRSYLVYPAWGRKGDCQFTLGEQNPDRYREALASYRTVLNADSASPALKLQAGYLIGRCLEQMDRRDEALQSFQRTMVHYQSERETLGPDALPWFLRAATAAARTHERNGQWRDAIRVYEQMVEARVPQSENASRRILEIRREQGIWF